MKKVRIIKIAGQTGLRSIGAVCSVSDLVADQWVKFGFAEILEDPKPKPKKKATKKTTKKKKEEE